jgi:hypothetical protein
MDYGEDKVHCYIHWGQNLNSKLFQEIHLKEALEKKSQIPTPEVILIDEDLYDKMYPVVSQSPPKGWIKTIRKKLKIFLTIFYNDFSQLKTEK